MLKRWILIGSSVVVALGVLALTLWWGGGLTGSSSSDTTENARRTPAEDMPAPPPFDPSRVISEDEIAQSQVFEDIGGGYTIVEGSRRIIMTWQKLTPQPQGVSDVTQPTAWVFFDTHRVLRIAAKQGTLVAPRIGRAKAISPVTSR